MKKVIALAIVAVMLVCSVSAAADFTTNAAPFTGNVAHVSYDEVRNADDSTNIVCGGDSAKINTPTFATGATGGIFWGWVSTNAEIAGFSYSVNGGEKVTDAAFKWDTEQAVIDAGPGPYDSRFKVPVPATEGTQLVRIFVDYADGTSDIFWTAEFTIGEATDYVDGPAAGDDEPAGEAADFGPWDGENFTTGWWMTRMAEGQTVTINFTAPNGFDGMKGFYFASAADVRINLYDAAGNELESIDQNFAADGAADTAFSKVYPAGAYTLKFTSLGGTHWVLGSCDTTGFECELTYENVDTNDATKASPCILFTGAADNTDTSDAAIVVVAAVAAIALAGVVVCKKVKA